RRVADVAALAVEDEEAAGGVDGGADLLQCRPALGAEGLEEGEVGLEGGGVGGRRFCYCNTKTSEGRSRRGEGRRQPLRVRVQPHAQARARGGDGPGPPLLERP